MKKMIDPKKKRTPPFSLRLTEEERARLERDAEGMALGTYIRSRIFDQSLPQRRTRGKHPVKDHQELGRILGALGRSCIAENLSKLAKAVDSGSLAVTPEMEKAIQNCCNDIKWIRYALVAALGLIVENDYDP